MVKIISNGVLRSIRLGKIRGLLQAYLHLKSYKITGEN